MDFFDKLGKKASEAYKLTADKTGKLAKETKLKMKMNELKGNINDIYTEIGKAVYENHLLEKKKNINKELDEKCTNIDCLSDEIEEIRKEILLLRNKKQCSKCFAEIDRETKFCPECGEKQEIPEPEAEVIEVEPEVIEEEQDKED